MPVFRHILVPTDGSTLSTHAAKTAIALAKLSKARMSVLHAIAPYSPPVYMDGVVPQPELFSPTEYKRSTQAYAKRVLGRIEALARAAKVPCDTVAVTHDQPWQAIVRAARTRGCDLIVMASHGRHGLEGLLLGSEAQKVLTHSKTPVLVCR